VGRPRSKGLATAFGRYLADKNIAYADAAADLGVHPRYLIMIACGSSTPGLKLAVAISKWTRRAIPVDAWRKPRGKK